MLELSRLTNDETDTLKDVIGSLIQIVDGFDQERAEAAKLGQDLEYSFGPNVSVDPALLRKLKELIHGHA